MEITKKSNKKIIIILITPIIIAFCFYIYNHFFILSNGELKMAKLWVESECHLKNVGELGSLKEFIIVENNLAKKYGFNSIDDLHQGLAELYVDNRRKYKFLANKVKKMTVEMCGLEFLVKEVKAFE